MGKSALAEQFIAELDRRDVVVLRGRCYERESVPYKGVDGVIDSLSRFMARLPDKDAAALLPFHVGAARRGVPRAARRAGDRRAAAACSTCPIRRSSAAACSPALRELLARLGARHPLVVLIDDLHWADEDSLALLDAVLRPPDAPCVLLVSTAWPRGEEPPIQFGGDLRAHGARAARRARDDAARPRAVVRACGAPAAEATICDDRARVRGPPDVRRRAAFATRSLRGDAGITGDEIRLDDVLAERIDALAAAERQLLELVATAGQPLPLEVASRALGVTPGAAAAAGRLSAVGESVARDRRERAATRSSRSTIARGARWSRAPRERKPELHRRLADRTRGDRCRDAADARRRALGAGRRTGARRGAVRARRRSRDRGVRVRARGQAVRALPRARARDVAVAAQPSSATRTRMPAVAARPPTSTSRSRASRRSPPTRSSSSRRPRTSCLRGGHIDDGMVVLERLLASVDIDLPKTPRRALASLLWRRARVRVRGTTFKPRDPSQLTREELARIDVVWSAACGLSMTDWIRGASFQTLNLLLSLQAGETFRARRALLLEACHVAASGGASARAERLVEAATGGEELEDPYLRGWVSFARGVHRVLPGQAGARRSRAPSRPTRCSAATARTWCGSATRCTRSATGRRSISARSRRSARCCRRASTRPSCRATSTRCGRCRRAISVLHWIARDDVAGGRAAVAPISERWSLRGYQIQHWNEMASNALLDIYAGDVRGARRRVEEGWVPMSRSLLTKVQIVRFEVHELQARTALAAAEVTSGSERERYLADRRAPHREARARRHGLDRCDHGAAARRHPRGARGHRGCRARASRRGRRLRRGRARAARRRRAGPARRAARAATRARSCATPGFAALRAEEIRRIVRYAP